MDILLVDSDGAAISLWQQVATENNIKLRVEDHFTSSDEVSGGDIRILDQSVFQSDYVDQILSLAAQLPQAVFVASGPVLNVSQVLDIVRGGIEFVFTKPLQIDDLRDRFREILAKSKTLAAQRAEYETLRKLFGELTRREKDVLELVLEGVSNRDSAEKLEVSVRTIEARRAKVYRKTKSTSVVELVRKVDQLERLSGTFFVPSMNGESDRTLRQDVAGSALHGERGSTARQHENCA